MLWPRGMNRHSIWVRVRARKRALTLLVEIQCWISGMLQTSRNRAPNLTQPRNQARHQARENIYTQTLSIDPNLNREARVRARKRALTLREQVQCKVRVRALDEL